MSVTYTVECTVLSNTEILPLVSVHYLKKKKKKEVGHGTILNQPRQGTAKCTE